MPALPGLFREYCRFRHQTGDPDRALSLNEGAIQPWTKPRYRALVNRNEEIRARE